MADPIGEFSFNRTGATFVKNDDGTVVGYINWDGSATGYGAVIGTMTIPFPKGGATSGTLTWAGQAFPPGGTWVTGSGEGTWEQIEGRYAWKVSVPVVEISDGSRIRSQGEIDLETTSYKGQNFAV